MMELSREGWCPLSQLDTTAEERWRDRRGHPSSICSPELPPLVSGVASSRTAFLSTKRSPSLSSRMTLFLASPLLLHLLPCFPVSSTPLKSQHPSTESPFSHRMLSLWIVPIHSGRPLPVSPPPLSWASYTSVQLLTELVQRSFHFNTSEANLTLCSSLLSGVTLLTVFPNPLPSMPSLSPDL